MCARVRFSSMYDPRKPSPASSNDMNVLSHKQLFINHRSHLKYLGVLMFVIQAFFHEQQTFLVYVFDFGFIQGIISSRKWGRTKEGFQFFNPSICLFLSLPGSTVSDTDSVFNYSSHP